MVNHQVQIMATKKLTLKLLVDKKHNKVLFAEANKDFIDFLFSLMSIPIGSVIRILSKQKMVGCLGDLYQSIQNLNETYIQPNQNKDSILKTKTANFASNSNTLLMISDEPTSTRRYYRCNIGGCNAYVTDTPGTLCPNQHGAFSYQMKQEVIFVAASTGTKNDVAANQSMADGGGFVKGGMVTYMVMDDLVVMPMSTISSITLLNKFNVQDVGTLEEKVVYLGMDEGLKLLEASLQSKHVLTKVFLGKVMYSLRLLGGSS